MAKVLEFQLQLGIHGRDLKPYTFQKANLKSSEAKRRRDRRGDLTMLEVKPELIEFIWM